MSDTLYLAELVVYDPGIGATRTLRYASQGFVTGPAETPANTYYDGRISQPINIKRDLFATGTTSGASRVGYGDLILANDDGALDALNSYAFDGRAITIRRGTVGAAYPSGFTTIFVGSMEQVEVNIRTVTVRVRDRQLDVQVPVQTTKYAGSNVLPAGLEGVDDLKGKPKPLALGAVRNVPAICVNTAKLIYQAHDGALASVDAVYDRGVQLAEGFGAFTSQTFGISDDINGICYGAGLFVAVCNSGKIRTSADGVSWAAQTSGFGTSHIRGVAYDATLKFVAVGDSGKVSTSPDGLTWTAQTTGVAVSLYAAAFHAGLMVVCGASGTLLTSPTGVTWTARTTGLGAVLYTALASSGVAIVVGSVSSAVGLVATSTDAITWVVPPTSIYNSALALCYADGVFVLGDSGGTILTSLDSTGITWVRADTPFGALESVTALAYGDGLVLASALKVGYCAFSYDNGRTWTLHTTPFGSHTLAASHGNGTFLLGGYSGTVGTSSGIDAYANSTDLLNDALAPAPGTIKPYLAGGYFRLGATPAGAITADVTQGAAAANRTAGQLFALVLQRAGKTVGDWSASDVTALDAAASGVCGVFIDGERKCHDLLDDIAASVGAAWWVDRSGFYRITQLTAPTLAASVASFTANDLLKPLDRLPLNDTGRGLPSYRTILRYSRNYTVQDMDLAAGVSDARRVVLGKEWAETASTDTAVQTAHPLAIESVIETLLSDIAGAAAEASRVQSLRGVRRDRFEICVALDGTTATIDLNDVVTLTHARYGLEAGMPMRVIGMSPDAAAGNVTYTLWGSTGDWRIDEDDEIRLTEDGDIRYCEV